MPTTEQQQQFIISTLRHHQARRQQRSTTTTTSPNLLKYYIFRSTTTCTAMHAAPPPLLGRRPAQLAACSGCRGASYSWPERTMMAFLVGVPVGDASALIASAVSMPRVTCGRAAPRPAGARRCLPRCGPRFCGSCGACCALDAARAALCALPSAPPGAALAHPRGVRAEPHSRSVGGCVQRGRWAGPHRGGRRWGVTDRLRPGCRVQGSGGGQGRGGRQRASPKMV